jgi:hypothetical protein
MLIGIRIGEHSFQNFLGGLFSFPRSGAGTVSFFEKLFQLLLPAAGRSLRWLFRVRLFRHD